MNAVIGIDIGGTKIAAGIVSFPEGALIHRRVIPTNATRGGDAVLHDVEKLIESLVAETRIDAIGVGVCELVNLRGEIISGNCVKWMDWIFAALSPNLRLSSSKRMFAPPL